MKNKKIEWCVRIGIGVVLFLLICTVIGCVATVNPQTGEETIRLSDGAAETISGIADIVEPIAIGSAVIFPGAAGISGLILGLIGMWKKMKPQVTAEKSAREMNYTILTNLVEAIELYKKEDTEGWKNLKAVLGDSTTLTAANVISEIRNIYKDHQNTE